MATDNVTAFDDERFETPAERDERIQYERGVIAQARAEIKAGLGIDNEDLKAWLAQLDHDENAPLPLPRRAPSVSR